MKLEVVAVPVSDVDRAKDFYQARGWRLDADFVTSPDFRVIQMNPARFRLRDHFRHRVHLGRARFGAQGLTTSLPGRATSALAAYDSLTGLAEALRRTAVAHGKRPAAHSDV